ncbi:hypothetical protein INR49_006461 [Caranx melampygus]|nr:hypothetical protein INR49_006461 [Caranx melampygus]
MSIDSPEWEREAEEEVCNGKVHQVDICAASAVLHTANHIDNHTVANYAEDEHNDEVGDSSNRGVCAQCRPLLGHPGDRHKQESRNAGSSHHRCSTVWLTSNHEARSLVDPGDPAAPLYLLTEPAEGKDDTRKLLFQDRNLGQIIISGSRHLYTQPPIPSPPPSATGVGLSVSMSNTRLEKDAGSWKESRPLDGLILEPGLRFNPEKTKEKLWE